MTSPLDLVTGGLGQASGLSLVTGGLLIITEVTTPFGGSGGAAPRRVDAKLVFSNEFGDADLPLELGDLTVENGLETALLLSLFTDQRASQEELERVGGDDPRGWWGDAYSKFAGDRFGSRLWLLERELQTPETLNRALEYARDAVQWLIDDRIARSVQVLAEFPSNGLLALQISPERASNEPRERFAFVWEL